MSINPAGWAVINDHGHKAGDAVLRAVADRARATVRLLILA